jgi:crotonobetainyl-CoA:carnitine CoA-transferase CaiB-like acyl-CoA transferase
MSETLAGTEMTDTGSPDSFLTGVRVVEVGDERCEYSGRLLAALGADVIKVEPPGGEATRTYGPFVDGREDRESSLYFWHYNLGKRSVVLDLDSSRDQATMRSLLESADILLESRDAGYFSERDLAYESLVSVNPGLLHLRITPFGDTGPWAHFKGSDLVHLALGGVMMNCGYSPDPNGEYHTPPIAPAMWQAYHITGEMAVIGILGALCHRWETGEGQQISVAVHDAVSANTETDVPGWIFRRQENGRQTCRHASPTASVPTISRTADGRWVLPYRTYLPGRADPFPGLLRLLQKHGMQGDLDLEKYQDPTLRSEESFDIYLGAIVGRLIEAYPFEEDLWKQAQGEDLAWAPLNRPHEVLDDPHFARRETFARVRHPELDREFRYTVGRWVADGIPWKVGPRAPLLGEHSADVVAALGTANSERDVSADAGSDEVRGEEKRKEVSKHGKPFALSGVRVLDLGWFLASGGAGSYLTAMGAEVIKVEHISRLDPMRYAGGYDDPNQSGNFMDIHTGKRGLSLNLSCDRGKEILTRLIAQSDMLIEGFSPGTLQRMGFSYETLQSINPRIIYVQQSAFGQAGLYGRMRSYGPPAQAFSGISEMSGLPGPYAPAGIGYSYLDWFGAYNMATAMLAALYRLRRTGKGCWIDASQIECGIYLTGTASLDFQCNATKWQRIGNSSPYKSAVPSGAFRTRGTDRWIAISCFDEQQWRSLVKVLELDIDPARSESQTARHEIKSELDHLIAEATRSWDGYDLMSQLQLAGVPAGVCQTGRDKVETDPQLAHHDWLVELDQRDIGKWPMKEVPIKFTKTPPYAGGVLDRAGPSYGEDTEYVLKQLLGLSDRDVNELREANVV